MNELTENLKTFDNAPFNYDCLDFDMNFTPLERTCIGGIGLLSIMLLPVIIVALMGYGVYRLFKHLKTH